MKNILLLCIFFPIYLIGCDATTDNNSTITGCVSENCKLIYEGTEYLTYDTKLKATTGKMSDEENEFQYRLQKYEKYITSGNSINNQFKIMKRDKENLETVYSHKNDNEAIFPFAVIDNQYIFSIMDYSEGTQQFVGLYQLNEKNKLEQLQTAHNEKTEKIFGVSISANNNIFALLYEDEKQNLYKTDLTLSNFEKVAEDVNQNLSTLGDDVCYVKNQKLLCGDNTVKDLEAGTVFAWVIGDAYILELDDTGNYVVSNIKDKKQLTSGKGFIGFDDANKNVTIYTEGKIEKLEG